MGIGVVAVAAALAAAAQDREVVRKPFRSATATNSKLSGEPIVRAANLVYAGSKTSNCFSDQFLVTTGRETNIMTEAKFDEVKLAKPELFDYPFAVMTGEGPFTLLETERQNLKSYLERGGFLLASAGCSSQEWDQAFRSEIGRIFKDVKLKRIPMDHPIFNTVFDINSVDLKKSAGFAQIEGLEIDGRIALIYSPEGLNDTANVPGCCCCGGNEIRNSEEVNVNVLTYSLTH
jgi:hypothetical protein